MRRGALLPPFSFAGNSVYSAYSGTFPAYLTDPADDMQTDML
jgi:hypothetical protein